MAQQVVQQAPEAVLEAHPGAAEALLEVLEAHLEAEYRVEEPLEGVHQAAQQLRHPYLSLPAAIYSALQDQS